MGREKVEGGEGEEGRGEREGEGEKENGGRDFRKRLVKQETGFRSLVDLQNETVRLPTSTPSTSSTPPFSSRSQSRGELPAIFISPSRGSLSFELDGSSDGEKKLSLTLSEGLENRRRHLEMMGGKQVSLKHFTPVKKNGRALSASETDFDGRTSENLIELWFNSRRVQPTPPLEVSDWLSQRQKDFLEVYFLRVSQQPREQELTEIAQKLEVLLHKSPSPSLSRRGGGGQGEVEGGEGENKLYVGSSPSFSSRSSPVHGGSFGGPSPVRGEKSVGGEEGEISKSKKKGNRRSGAMTDRGGSLRAALSPFFSFSSGNSSNPAPRSPVLGSSFFLSPKDEEKGVGSSSSSGTLSARSRRSSASLLVEAEGGEWGASVGMSLDARLSEYLEYYYSKCQKPTEEELGKLVERLLEIRGQGACCCVGDGKGGGGGGGGGAVKGVGSTQSAPGVFGFASSTATSGSIYGFSSASTPTSVISLPSSSSSSSSTSSSVASSGSSLPSISLTSSHSGSNLSLDSAGNSPPSTLSSPSTPSTISLTSTSSFDNCPACCVDTVVISWWFDKRREMELGGKKGRKKKRRTVGTMKGFQQAPLLLSQIRRVNDAEELSNIISPTFLHHSMDDSLETKELPKKISSISGQKGGLVEGGEGGGESSLLSSGTLSRRKEKHPPRNIPYFPPENEKEKGDEREREKERGGSEKGGGEKEGALGEREGGEKEKMIIMVLQVPVSYRRLVTHQGTLSFSSTHLYLDKREVAPLWDIEAIDLEGNKIIFLLKNTRKQAVRLVSQEVDPKFWHEEMVGVWERGLWHHHLYDTLLRSSDSYEIQMALSWLGNHTKKKWCDKTIAPSAAEEGVAAAAKAAKQAAAMAVGREGKGGRDGVCLKGSRSASSKSLSTDPYLFPKTSMVSTSLANLPLPSSTSSSSSSSSSSYSSPPLSMNEDPLELPTPACSTPSPFSSPSSSTSPPPFGSPSSFSHSSPSTLGRCPSPSPSPFLSAPGGLFIPSSPSTQPNYDCSPISSSLSPPLSPASFPIQLTTVVPPDDRSITDQRVLDRLIHFVKNQDSPYDAAAALVLAHSVKHNCNRDYILQQGSRALMSFLVRFATEGWLTLHSPLDPSEIEYLRMVGSGAAAGVWEVKWKGRGGEVEETEGEQVEGKGGEGERRRYAVKKFHMASVGEDLREFKSEVAIMSILYHPNVVPCLAACLEDSSSSHPLLISPLYERGALLGILEDSSIPLPPRLVVSMALDAAQGMQYLHSFQLIHRDLKPENLLVSGDWKVVVSDFGISKVLSECMTKAVGSSLYIAPEVFATNTYTSKVDVYGFGYCLWALWEREIPFKDYSSFQLISMVVEEGERPVIRKGCPYGGIMGKCWHKDPNLRPSFSKIVYEVRKLLDGMGE